MTPTSFEPVLVTAHGASHFALDARLVWFWLCVELWSTIIIVAVLWLCSFLGRHMWARKTLHGQRVLITNGDAELSQALADQLTDVYHCRVVLIRSGKGGACGGNRGHSLQHHLRTEFECNVLDTGELLVLQERVRKELGWVDVLIENGLPAASAAAAGAADVRRFVETASDSIRTTINLILTFIPALAKSERGHYVTIQPSARDARPFLDSTSEVRRLIGHLHQQENPDLPAVAGHHNRLDASITPQPASPWQFDATSDELRLSTIVVRPKDPTAPAGPRDLGAVELAERVIAGIRREQRLLELHERRGLLEYVVDMVWR